MIYKFLYIYYIYIIEIVISRRYFNILEKTLNYFTEIKIILKSDVENNVNIILEFSLEHQSSSGHREKTMSF